MRGAAGIDTFVFSPGFGSNVITDFRANLAQRRNFSIRQRSTILMPAILPPKLAIVTGQFDWAGCDRHAGNDRRRFPHDPMSLAWAPTASPRQTFTFSCICDRHGGEPREPGRRLPLLVKVIPAGLDPGFCVTLYFVRCLFRFR
jgi:hypothetical protein